MRLRLLVSIAGLFSLAGCATPTVSATNSAPGMVSAADPRAADAGAQMLRQGGSATDAAFATLLTLNVVEPQSSGIGGGGYLVYSEHGGAAGDLRRPRDGARGCDRHLVLQGRQADAVFRSAAGRQERRRARATSA